MVTAVAWKPMKKNRVKEIEIYLLCEILISKDTLQGPKTVVSLLNARKREEIEIAFSSS